MSRQGDFMLHMLWPITRGDMRQKNLCPCCPYLRLSPYLIGCLPDCVGNHGWLADKEYARHKVALDQVPLPQFAWVLQWSPSDVEQPAAEEAGPQSSGQHAPVNGASEPSMNGQHAPVNGGSEPPMTGQHAAVNGASEPPMNQQHLASNGASPSAKQDTDNGSWPSAGGQPHAADGASSNAPYAPVNGSAPTVNKLHQSSNEDSFSGQQGPVNGPERSFSGQHQSSNGAVSNGQPQASNGASSNGQPYTSNAGASPNGQPGASTGASPSKEEPPAYGPRPPPSSEAQPTQGQLQDLNTIAFVLKRHLPGPLADRLWRTASVCCVSQHKMSVDAAQDLISTVLDEAETLQAQIITDAWYIRSQ